jgi:hypothetical protein
MHPLLAEGTTGSVNVMLTRTVVAAMAARYGPGPAGRVV